jgi:para-nitrobenzyl esterase
MSRDVSAWTRTFLRGAPAIVLLLLANAAMALSIQATTSQKDPLEDTSWQLVQYRGGDGTIVTPDDRGKYTLAFAAAGELTARLDCNRGGGTWKSSGRRQIEFGPLALTHAKCPPESLHDQMVKHWSLIRSYVLKDGHLFLSLADGGTYEFEPMPKAGK